MQIEGVNTVSETKTSLLIGLLFILILVFVTINDAEYMFAEDNAQVYLPIIIQGDCYKWHGQEMLQNAVNQHRCVEMQAGVWETHVQISMPQGYTLRGVGFDQTTLKAIEPWDGNGVDNTVEAVVHNNGNSSVYLHGFTIDANFVATLGIASFGITADSMRVIHAECDGIGINGPNMVIRNSIIELNAKTPCPHTGVAGSGIYMTVNVEGYADYAPIIVNNIIRNNNGPGLDVDRVWGGTFSNNEVHGNAAWAAVSLYGASNWHVENNRITHPHSANAEHPGHPMCHITPFGEYSSGIALCRDDQDSFVLFEDDNKIVARVAVPVDNNQIINNTVSGGYGILTIGDDEWNPSTLPMNNLFQGNDVTGSIIGCADDLTPFDTFDDLNTWNNNNCTGVIDTLPHYFDILCPNGIQRSKVTTWDVGEVPVEVVNEYVDRFNNLRTAGGGFSNGTTVPAGVLIATNFAESGNSWQQFPVQPIAHYQDYGLFETMDSYTAPFEGACITIIP